MASTRNKNMKGEYCLEQNRNTNTAAYNTYPHSAYGTSSVTALPDAGVNPGKYPITQLSYNPIDIESNLRGIGGSNMVTGPVTVTPALKKLPTVAFFKRGETYIPEPLVVETTNRPQIP